MTRELLVAIHAGSGIIGLMLGLRVFTPPETRDDRLIPRLAYGALLTVLVASLLAMIAIDWSGLELGARVAFPALAALGLVMITRFALAHRLAGGDEPDSRRRYVEHIYFTYISLWVGFAIIPALRSGNPGLWIPVAVVGVLAAGSVAIQRYKHAIGVVT